MARAELFFGRDGVSDAEWDGFVREELTAAFPQGLTVLAGQGQWRDPASGALVRESSRVVVALVEADGAPEKLSAVAAVYEHRFDQASVLISLAPVCAAF